jgi:hypothetical protein
LENVIKQEIITEEGLANEIGSWKGGRKMN